MCWNVERNSSSPAPPRPPDSAILGGNPAICYNKPSKRVGCRMFKMCPRSRCSPLSRRNKVLPSCPKVIKQLDHTPPQGRSGFRGIWICWTLLDVMGTSTWEDHSPELCRTSMDVPLPKTQTTLEVSTLGARGFGSEQARSQPLLRGT